jgi:hypothetical protein
MFEGGEMDRANLNHEKAANTKLYFVSRAA